MQKDIENKKPHLCVPTLDGNAHVIPAEVFDKIISGEMKITDMDDWEIITRTAFSEWLRGLDYVVCYDSPASWDGPGD